MDDFYIRTYYISHRIELPLYVACAAYDALVTPQRCVLEAIRTRLVIAGPSAVSSGTSYGPVRSAPALLVAGHHRHPVELELLPWASGHTELGLRPGRTLLHRFPSEAVMRAGLRLLPQLADEMCAWADAPLRQVVTQPCGGPARPRRPASRVAPPALPASGAVGCQGPA